MKHSTRKDLYTILGVESDSSSEEMREAYLARTRVLHPDRFDPQRNPKEWKKANEMLAELNEAYSILRNQNSRETYDQAHANRQQREDSPSPPPEYEPSPKPEPESESEPVPESNSTVSPKPKPESMLSSAFDPDRVVFVIFVLIGILLAILFLLSFVISSDSNTEKLSNNASKAIRKPFNDIPMAKGDYMETNGGVDLEMVLLPSGTFLMGDKDINPPVHDVILAGFWIGKNEITVGEYQKFVDDAGYQTTAEREGWAYTWSGSEWIKTNGVNWRSPGFPQTVGCPVTTVSWDDASAFCRWLSNKSKKLYLLPNEAQWEYACRGGTRTEYPWGDDPDGGKGWANGWNTPYEGKYARLMTTTWDDGYVYTSPVGTFKANGFGLYDMIGNVEEWCQDWFHEDYVGAPKDGSSWDYPVGNGRVLRGGSWHHGAAFAMSSSRARATPQSCYNNIGFRVIRIPSFND